MGDMHDCDVCVVQGTQAGNPFWPTLEDIASYFMRNNPRTLRLDNNTAGPAIRGIALNLTNGKVSEIDGSKGWTWSRYHDTSSDEVLYDISLGY